MKNFRFRNLSLRYKINLVHSLAFALIFAVGSMIIFYVQKRSIESNVEDSLKNATSALVNMVNVSSTMSVKNYLRAIAEKNRDIVQNFYLQYQQGKLTEEEAKAKATEVLFSQTVGKTGYIYCIDSQGVVLVHPKSGVLGMNVANFEFVRKQIRWKEGYLEYDWKNPDETLERPKALYMTYFQPWDWIISVSSYREEFKDMVNVNNFRENIVSQKFGKTGYTFILGYNGVPLVHPYAQMEGKSFLEEKDAAGRRFIAEMCEKKNGKIIYPWKNPGETSAREKLTIFGDISEFGWIVGSSVYLDELYEPLDTFRNLVFGIGFVAMFFLFPLTSMRISSYITGSLQTLMHKLSSVSDGDFSARMEIHSKDEIGQLASYFNTFMEKIESSARAVEESERKYRSLFENAVEGIFQSVPGGGYLSVNTSFAKIFGYDSPEELLASVTDIGKQLYVNPEDREEMVRIIKEKGSVEGFEAQLYRKDRSIIWVSVYARRVLDNQGNMLCYEGSFMDITSMKQTEKELKKHQEHLEEMVEKRTAELRESERKLYNMIDFLPDAVFVIDKDGKVIAWNRAMEKMTGAKADDMIGKGNYEYALPFYGKRRPILIDLAIASDREIEKKYPRLKREEGQLTSESFTQNLPGGEAYLLASASALYDSKGNITGAVELIRDITDRKKAEDELVQTKEYLENVIENSPNAISLRDRQGKFVKWNKMSAQLSGYSFEEIQALPVTELYADKNEFENLRKEVQQHGVVSRYEIRMKKRNGTVIPVETSVSVLKDKKQNIVGVLSIVSDLSDIKKALKETLAAREAAESANRAKSAFLATMSHEIRTPMNGVIGMTGLLLASDLTKEQHMFAENIRNSGESLLTIINDILDFSKIEAGQMELEKVPFNLRECAESALDLVAVKAGEKGLDLVCMAEPDLPAAVMGDETRLRQILLNLLGNAVKFTHKGEVVVSVSGYPLSSEAVSAETAEAAKTWDLYFAVKDSGIGIPADRMDRLFKSFSQVDSSTTRKYGGTGLGLVISKKLVEMMGGTMQVESTEGKGTVFSFSIRAVEAEVSKPVYMCADQPSLNGRHVMIVDDNEVNREILLRQTGSWGMRPEAFSSGAEALGSVRSGTQYDLAILDMQMPEMDGTELSKAIHQESGSEKMPLVMMSSAGQMEKEEIRKEFAAWLLKPVRQSQLYNVLTEVFAGDSAQTCVREDEDGEPEFDPQMGKNHPLRILVAEDNSINQQLALLTLERLGYMADIAGNGLEAVDAVRRQFYDAVLMDVQMPEMDGLEATKQIRREFPAERQPRIIAMTANALQGDREMCLNAGMDDYVSKPFKVKELIRALSQCPSRGKSEKREESPQTADAANTAQSAEISVQECPAADLDPAALKNLTAMLGKKAAVMLPKLIDDFFRDAVKKQEEARQAMEHGKTEDLRRAVHTLKSNAKNFGATVLAQLCQETENIAKSGSCDVSALLRQIETEYPKVRAALEIVRGGL
ncbi:MAG: PAS domain S-box protein [Desulfococcaceae bacterium]